MTTNPPAIIRELLNQLRSRGRMPAAELLNALGVSRPTLARAVAAEASVVRIGRARATQYALIKELRGQSRWPLYRLNALARVEHLGTLIALGRGEFALQSEQPRPTLMHPPFERGVYPDIPWFLEDLRPNGFLGRAYAHRAAKSLRLPADLKVWNAEHIIVVLLNGDSTQSGDLILGEQSLERALADLQDPPDLLIAAERQLKYPDLAAAVIRGEPPGSSAGGEQSKFTATVDGPEGRYSAIVKFSANEDNSVARRWASLLRCEALAASTLSERGISTAETRIVESAGQVFLESRRFDRTAAQGRRGFVSLAALNAAFYGEASSPWWQLAGVLERDGWLSIEDATNLRRVSWFGALIANADMHLGNFGLILTDHLPLQAAPVYDMLPMLLRPNSQGVVVAREYSAPLPAAGQHQDWHWAAESAIEFWRHVHSTEEIDAQVRSFALRAEREIQRVAERF